MTSAATHGDHDAAESQPAPDLDFRFSGFGYQNWGIDGEPPIMVNPKASLHHKLAWCWGEVNQIDEFALTLCQHENETLQRVGNMLASRTISLTAMLEHLGETTCSTEGRG